jgi:aminoglycoside phosphotransferase (APT) family kinase protein
VFRGHPLYPGQFETERFMAGHLHKETKAPVPWPYFVDESDDAFGWPYAIMPRLPGLQLASPEVKAKLSGPDRLEIAEAMGVNLAGMHRFRQPYPGTYNPATESVLRLAGTYRPPWKERDHTDTDASIDASASSEQVFYRWISSRINYFLNNALESSDQATGRVTTLRDEEWIAGILNDSKAALLKPFQPCFVMNDYKEGNTVAERIDGRWQVTGVFDLMEAYFGDGEADLSRSLAAYGIADKGSDERAYAFLDAYLRTREDQAVRPGFTERFAVYMAMDRMIMWAYGRKEGWFDGFADFRSYCEPYLILNTGKLPAILCASGA